MILLDEALDTILKNVGVLNSITLTIREAYGMVLAEDVYSDSDIPPFHKSAMDGYALMYQGFDGKGAVLKVIQSVAAGSPAVQSIGRGECIKVMTGATVPEAADSVVMIEETEEQPGGRIKIKAAIKSGQNICRKGEDIKKGEVVLHKGAWLKGPEIAILSSVGRSEVRVIRKPTVGILSTGNEIVEPEVVPGQGKIRNSNGPMLEYLVDAAGCTANYLGIGSDCEEELLALIKKGLKNDVLLISGGVSMGDYDLIPGLLKKEGADIFFHKVRIKPGKPLLFAKKSVCHIFGIPGNPVSNFTTFNLFIKPALLKLMGKKDFRLNFIEARLREEVKRKGLRAWIIPSRCKVKDGRFEVTPFKLSGSADIIGCSGCNCLTIIDSNKDFVQLGEEVKVLLLDF